VFVSSTTRPGRRPRIQSRAEASILHADLDAFFASVEQRDDPSLRGRPVVVGGGVVLAASYEAKAKGVRTAMPGFKARQLCPDLVTVPARFDAYTQASRDVFAIFDNTTPMVEGISIDEAFLDVGGLRRASGTPEAIAARLRATVAADVGLPITVGIARTKFLAKVASAVAKPDGLLLVPPDGEEAFLHPLPVERLWGVGKVTAEKLHALGVTTVADLAAMTEHGLSSFVGPASGRHLHALARLLDPRPVVTGRRRRSIGSQRALGTRPKSDADIDAALIGLVDRVTRRMRAAERKGRTVTLRLRFIDFTRATRSHTLSYPTSRTEPILATGRDLLAGAREIIRRQGLSLIGISVANFDGDPDQLELPFLGLPGDALDGAVDRIRDRFGSAALTRGALVGRDPGISMPVLPD
jgi:DNA polymerase-4